MNTRRIVRGELQQEAVAAAVDETESVAQRQFVGRLSVDAVHDVSWSHANHFRLAARLHLQHLSPLYPVAPANTWTYDCSVPHCADAHLVLRYLSYQTKS